MICRKGQCITIRAQNHAVRNNNIKTYHMYICTDAFYPVMSCKYIFIYKGIHGTKLTHCDTIL